MVPGLFGFQSQALPYLIHSLIPEGSRLSAGLSPFLPLVCLLLRFVVLLLAMPSTTLPYIQPFAEFYFVLSDRLLAAQSRKGPEKKSRADSQYFYRIVSPGPRSPGVGRLELAKHCSFRFPLRKAVLARC